MSDDWVWDPSPYAGSARYYALGRLPCPPLVADVLRDVLALDGTARLLDVGCGPGALTLVLAGLFSEAIGVDADGARRRTYSTGSANSSEICAASFATRPRPGSSGKGRGQSCRRSGLLHEGGPAGCTRWRAEACAAIIGPWTCGGGSNATT